MGVKLKGKKCERCGSDDSNELTRHHKRVYRSMGGTSHPDNIEILCKDCHKLLHLKDLHNVTAPLVIKHSVDGSLELPSEIEGAKRYSQDWYMLSDTKDLDKGFYVSVCGFSHRITDVEPASSFMFLIALMANDVYVSEGDGCERKLKCLVTNCKYNETTPESFPHQNEKELAWLKKNWNVITNLRPVKALCKRIGLRPYR